MKTLYNPSSVTKVKLSSVGIQIQPGTEFTVPFVAERLFAESEEVLAAVRTGKIQVGDGTTRFTNPVAGEVYIRNLFGDDCILANADGDIAEYTNVLVTDAPSGATACSQFMLMLTLMRELYNAPDNPVYLPTFQPLLGVNGTLQAHLNRTTALEGSLATLSDSVTNHGWRIANAEGAITSLDGRTLNLETIVGGVAPRVTSLEGRVTALENGSAPPDGGGETGGEDPALAARVTALETSLGKLGRHTQEARTASWKRPADLLFFYGWPTSFNSATNAWTLEKVAQEMARYGLVIFGNGLQETSHGDHANLQTIVNRIKLLNPSTKLFGYVTAAQPLADFATKAGQWNDMGIHGIFLDECGYDYGSVETNGRDGFNARVDAVHGLSSARIAFVNAWNVDHVIGTFDGAGGYPNATYNPTFAASHLTADDWYLLESFAVNTDSYAGGYATKSDWAYRGVKAIGHRATMGVNLAAVGIIDDGAANGQDLFNFHFVSSLMWSLDAQGTSHSYYGAGTSTSKYWTRPSVASLSRVWSLTPSVQQDGLTATVDHRYVEAGRLSLDWAAGSATILTY
jgi:hypothetical protein